MGMMTGSGALGLAFLGALVFVLLIWRLGRQIPPTPDGAETAWREGWLTRYLPFGRQPLAPIGQPDPVAKPSRRSRVRYQRDALAVVTGIVVGSLVVELITCSTGERTLRSWMVCFAPRWWALVILTGGLLVVWITVDRLLNRLDSRKSHPRKSN